MADAEAAVAQSRSSRTYEDALVALNTLITRKADAPITDPVTGVLNWQTHFQSLFRCLEVLELQDDLSRLSVIHVAGTKGKGSTCAFTERMLRESGFRTGLFTSPHLLDVRERFRFNGEEISKDRFLHYFWWCWDRLKAENEKLPGFFRFCTLLSLKMFLEEKVDVAILEVGLGGRLDATNVVKSPVVCGIASLGYDHMELLGHTLAEIAREKAGIFKAGVPAFTAPQQEEAMGSLQKRANELGITLEVAPSLEDYGLHNLPLGLGGEHQHVNAALAVALCKQWTMARAPSEHITRLQKSPESMEACANRFCSTIKSEGNPKVPKLNNSSPLSILGTDDERWNAKGYSFKCKPPRDCMEEEGPKQVKEVAATSGDETIRTRLSNANANGGDGIVRTRSDTLANRSFVSQT